MRIAFGADEATHLTVFLVEESRQRGHAVSAHGPPGALCLSLRATTEPVAREILDAWFAVTAPDPTEAANIDRVRMQDIARGPL